MKKIVIEIDDDLYNEILSRKYSKTRLEKAVANGTLLPKGHGDLIDRNELLDESYQIDSMYCMYDEVVNVNDIKNAPTILEADKCTYKETGCGSCKRQLDCPIEARGSEIE